MITEKQVSIKWNSLLLNFQLMKGKYILKHDLLNSISLKEDKSFLNVFSDDIIDPIYIMNKTKCNLVWIGRL
jgi:hypothetical protein